MFYSEQLLSKTGPLARVWLAANVERKLSKTQVLQQDIQKSIGAIVDQGQAPMALRLSGQLMLGVVRIYGKKATYLQADCHEALLKIRMTFRNTGSHDLPANATTGVDLNLPEMLTIDDLFPSMDFAYPLTQQPALPAPQQDMDPDEDWTSSLNPINQSTQSRLSPLDDPLVNNDDLGLNFDDEGDTGISIQRGRNAPAARNLEEDIMGDTTKAFAPGDDFILEYGDDTELPQQPAGDMDNDLPMPNIDQQDLILPDDEAALEAAQQRPRATSSALSEANSDLFHQHRQDQDQTFQAPDSPTEIMVQQRQRSKKIRPLERDIETTLHSRQIREQNEDRSKILRQPTFLPRDPTLLTLMELQKSGAFATIAMNDGRSKAWASELQGLLSFDAVHRSGGRKRKRDSGIGGLTDDEHLDKSPRRDNEEPDEGVDVEAGRDRTSLFDLPAAERSALGGGIMSDGITPALGDMVPGEDNEGIFPHDDDEEEAQDDFDETTMPLVHPAEAGPVSVSTKRAVQLLRQRLAGQTVDGSPSSSQKKSVLLQDIVPERKTSKEDATKMFFEVLVLATKDAIKVEQSDQEIGLPLRIRGKRGLWGSWADEGGAQVEEEVEGVGA